MSYSDNESRAHLEQNVVVQSAEQLSGRLTEVEEALAALCSLPAVNRDAEATQMAARLAGRVDRLRDAVDALGAGQPG